MSREIGTEGSSEVAVRVAEHAPTLLVYVDSALILRFVSGHSHALLGRHPADLVGRPLAELVDPGTLRHARRHAERVEQGDGAPREYVLRDRCGTRKVVLVHATPDRDARGHSLGYFACTSDDCGALAMRHELARTQALLARRTLLLIELAQELRAAVLREEAQAPFPTQDEGAP